MEIALRNGNEDMVAVLRQIGAKKYEETVAFEASLLQEQTIEEDIHHIEHEHDDYGVVVDDQTSNEEDMSHQSYDTGIVINEEPSSYSEQLKREGKIMSIAMDFPLGTSRAEIISILGEPEYNDSYFPVMFYYDDNNRLDGMHFVYAMPHGYDITKEGIQRGDLLEKVNETYQHYERTFHFNDIHDFPKFMFVYIGDEFYTFEFSEWAYDGAIHLVGFGRGNQAFIERSSIISYQSLEERPY